MVISDYDTMVRLVYKVLAYKAYAMVSSMESALHLMESNRISGSPCGFAYGSCTNRLNLDGVSSCTELQMGLGRHRGANAKPCMCFAESRYRILFSCFAEA